MYIRQYEKDDVRRLDIVDTETGESVSISSATDPSFDEKEKQVINLVKNGASFVQVRDLVTQASVKNSIREVREKLGITIDGDGVVHFPNGLTLPPETAQVFKDITSMERGRHLLAFMDELKKNPFEHARVSLIQWIVNNPSLTILPDGRIRGFRGNNNELCSIHSGYGVVNGVEMRGNLPNYPGNIIEFPAELADHNPKNRCSVGLHVGTKEYAYDFGVRWVTVAFSPADVISFPDDGTTFKIRVTKMEILDEVDDEYMSDVDTP